MLGDATPRRQPLLAGREAARDLRAIILLAGRVGLNPLADGVARSVLDLPVDRHRTLLDVWAAQFEEFAETFELPSVRVCVSVDQHGSAPRVRPVDEHPRVQFEVVRDPGEYRGTAGVVRDLTKVYKDEGRVLVAAANQIQRESFSDLFQALCEHDESVSIAPHRGSEIAGMFLLRCARMRDVPEVGFVDLKEQAIPSARGHAPLYVTRRPVGSLLPVRTLEEYVHALRVSHSVALPDPNGLSPDDPFAETWMPVFSIIENGATVAAGATVQDSVVLAGGRVDSGAALARSVVCPGGVVRRGQVIVDSIVTAQ